jgi:hypothetical protein
MVLLTPFLVLMGALMICFGDAALWKIRAQTAVHYAGTQTESFRGSQFAGFPPNPRPETWPSLGSMSGSGGRNVSSVQNLFWNQSGPEDVAALQGNIGGGSQTSLVDPYQNNQTVVNRQMFADRGVHAGAVSLTKQFPMLTRLLPSNGTYRVSLQSQFLTGDWYFSNLGLGGNESRRAARLYVIDPTRIPGVMALWQDFIADFRQLPTVPPAINYLDNDAEWLIYHPGGRPPDFYPPRPGGCELDLIPYSESSQFKGHLRQILLVPRNMAMAWRRVYLGELGARMNPDYTPKGPLSDDELKNRADILSSYISRLQAAGY